jgi:hypothetical protein
MTFTRKTALLLPILALSVLIVGCGGNQAREDPETVRRKNELGQIYDLCMGYLKTNQRPPAKLADLNQKHLQTLYPEGFSALQSGRYTVVYGEGMRGKSAGTVLAYEKAAPEHGGAVLMADGTVKTMTAEELRAALKPGS